MNNNIKNAFDSIGPSDEQKKRMLDNILASKKTEKVHSFRFVPYLAGAMAVLMIGVGIYTYGNVLNRAGISNSSNSGVDNVVSNIHKPNDMDTTPIKPDTVYSENDKTEQSNTKNERANLPSSEKMNAGSKNLTSDTHDLFLVNDYSLLSVNAVTPKAAAMFDEYESDSVEMTKEQYFEYLGEDFSEIIYVPDGMQLTTDETKIFAKDNDTIENDEWYFVYTSDDDRSLSVITSKILGKTEEILSDSDSLDSKFNNLNVKIYGNEEQYTVYFIKNNISYTVSAYGISEPEMKNIISSITK